MKRRTFVRNAAVGALGVSVQPSFAYGAGNTKTHIWDWMQHLKDLGQTKRRTQAQHDSASFLALVENLNQYFSARGYAPVAGAGFFFTGAVENTCFFPVQLRNARAGATDLLVPMLALNAEGKWYHALTLTGYQLEALHHAAQKMDAQQFNLADYLLPFSMQVSNQHNSPYFNTKMGALCIETRIEGNQSKTQVTVTANNEIVLSDTFISKHCLTSSPMFTPLNKI
jgi:hypothetical protein